MSLKSNNIVLTIEKGANFFKTFRWKDKYKEPINLTGFYFKSQFRYDYGDDNVLCTLINGDGITITPLEGEIEIYISSEITSELKNYDSGLWSLEYKTSIEGIYKKLIGGIWKVEAEVTS